MKHLISAYFVTIAATLSLLSSCASPAGHSPVDPSEPHAILTTKAILKSAFPLVQSNTIVKEIDGVVPPFIRWDDTFRIAPGRHVLGLQNTGGSLGALVLMTLNAEAGQTYVVKSDQIGGLKMKFWIENKATGAIVASKEADLQIVPTQRYTPIFIPLPAG